MGCGAWFKGTGPPVSGLDLLMPGGGCLGVLLISIG